MPTHYDVLGVSQHAAPEDVRRAYLDLARELHPDRTLGASAVEAERAARRMQEVNEAWRVLRDPSSRAAYDRALGGGKRPPPRPAYTPSHAAPPSFRRPSSSPLDPDDDAFDRPVSSGEGVSVVRAAPWVAMAVVLLVIFVFTALAREGGAPSSPQDLVDKCISASGSATPVEVPCGGPNDGRVVLVADRAPHCPDGSSSLPVDDGKYLCIEPTNGIPSFTTTSAP